MSSSNILRWCAALLPLPFSISKLLRPYEAPEMASGRLKTDAILGNTVWYTDKLVTWPDAQSWWDAMWLAERKVKRLRRKAKKGLKPDYDQLRVADTLAGCKEYRRCLDGACPECVRALKRWLTKRVVTLAANEPPKEVFAITVVPAVPLSNAITGPQLAMVMAGIRIKLVGTGLVEWAVFGLDVSYNDFTQVSDAWPAGVPKAGWQPHVHGFVRVKDINAFKTALAALFPPALGIPEPVRLRRYDGSAYGASYALKNEFHRRVSYFEEKNGVLNAWDYPLTAKDDIKLMRALSELGLAGRIELIGLSAVHEPKKKKVKLIVTTTAGQVRHP